MLSRLAELALCTALAGGLLLANASCASRHADDAPTGVPRPNARAHGAQRLLRFSFGAQAVLGLVVEPS